MQMYLPGADTANFEPVLPWYEALTAPGAPGADQMRHLKALIESRPMPDRVPDPSLIVDNGPRYDRVLASRGKGYAFAYSRPEEHTSYLQSLMRTSYAVFCLKNKKETINNSTYNCVS